MYYAKYFQLNGDKIVRTKHHCNIFIRMNFLAYSIYTWKIPEYSNFIFKSVHLCWCWIFNIERFYSNIAMPLASINRTKRSWSNTWSHFNFITRNFPVIMRISSRSLLKQQSFVLQSQSSNKFLNNKIEIRPRFKIYNLELSPLSLNCWKFATII